MGTDGQMSRRCAPHSKGVVLVIIVRFTAVCTTLALCSAVEEENGGRPPRLRSFAVRIRAAAKADSRGAPHASMSEPSNVAARIGMGRQWSVTRETPAPLMIEVTTVRNHSNLRPRFVVPRWVVWRQVRMTAALKSRAFTCSHSGASMQIALEWRTCTATGARQR